MSETNGPDACCRYRVDGSVRTKSLPQTPETQASGLWEQVWPMPSAGRAGAAAKDKSAKGGGAAASASQAGSIAAGGAASARSRRWTADEAQRFGELMARSRKDVAKVARELGAGRTVGDVLAFYYGKWKQTDASAAPSGHAPRPRPFRRTPSRRIGPWSRRPPRGARRGCSEGF